MQTAVDRIVVSYGSDYKSFIFTALKGLTSRIHTERGDGFSWTTQTTLPEQRVLSTYFLEKLEDIRGLCDGWVDNGIAIGGDVLARAQMLAQKTAYIAGEPDIIPALDGAVQLIWYFGPSHYFTLYVDADGEQRPGALRRGADFKSVPAESLSQITALLRKGRDGE